MKNDVKDHIFHNASNSANNGIFLEVEYFKTLTVEIYGSIDNSARTVLFYAMGPSKILRDFVGVKLSAAPLATAVSTTGISEIWQFDITGLTRIYMVLSSITDGTVTIKGRAVS